MANAVCVKVLGVCGSFKIKHQQSDAQLHRSVCLCMGKQGFAHECMNFYTVHLSLRLQAQLSSIIVLRHYSQGLPGSHLSHTGIGMTMPKMKWVTGPGWNVCRVYVYMCACQYDDQKEQKADENALILTHV